MKKSSEISTIAQVTVCLAAAVLALPGRAQQVEPRRWSHLPVDVNFAGGGYAYTNAGISADPVLRLEDVNMDMHTIPYKYIRTFEMLGKSARVDWMNAYHHARWNGLLDGDPRTTSRSGWSDMAMRFAVNVIGAPPLSGEEFAQYRAATEVETIAGLGLVVHLPTGHYLQDKLLNLGENRFVFRPQAGVVHNRGKWSTEATVSSWIYTDNNEFFGDRRREQDPLYTVQGHLNYTFRPGLWAGGGIAYGAGGVSTVDGDRKDDRKENIAWALGFGYPFSRQVGVKIAYIGTRTQRAIGASTDTLAVTTSVMW